MKDLVPLDAENSRPIKAAEEVLSEVGEMKAEQKRLKAQAGVPLMKSFKDEVIRRAESGELKRDLKGMKLSTLIRDLSIIKQLLEDNLPSVVVVAPPAPASEGKDQTWRKAYSISGKTNSERAKMRAAIEGEKA